VLIKKKESENNMLKKLKELKNDEKSGIRNAEYIEDLEFLGIKFLNKIEKEIWENEKVDKYELLKNDKKRFDILKNEMLKEL
jgi:hypothetical protein